MPKFVLVNEVVVTVTLGFMLGKHYLRDMQLIFTSIYKTHLLKTLLVPHAVEMHELLGSFVNQLFGNMILREWWKFTPCLSCIYQEWVTVLGWICP